MPKILVFIDGGMKVRSDNSDVVIARTVEEAEQKSPGIVSEMNRLAGIGNSGTSPAGLDPQRRLRAANEQAALRNRIARLRREGRT